MVTKKSLVLSLATARRYHNLGVCNERANAPG